MKDRIITAGTPRGETEVFCAEVPAWVRELEILRQERACLQGMLAHEPVKVFATREG